MSRTEMITAEPAQSKAELMLREILASICKFTKEPRIEFSQETQRFTVEVDSRDQGRVIGRKGINYWAINALMHYAGLTSYGYVVGVSVLEPRVRSKVIENPFKPSLTWDESKIRGLVRTILDACFNQHAKDFEISNTGYAEALVTVFGEVYLPHDDPNFAEAIDTIVHAAGMGLGVRLKTQMIWT